MMSGAFIIPDAVKKMLKIDKDSDVYNYMEFYINILNIVPFNLSTLCTIIIMHFPISKKELGLKIIRKMKEESKEIKITLIKNDNKTGSRAGGSPGELIIETGNEETIEKVGWFKGIFYQ